MSDWIPVSEPISEEVEDFKFLVYLTEYHLDEESGVTTEESAIDIGMRCGCANENCLFLAAGYSHGVHISHYLPLPEPPQ